ncbi:hypothetical protein NMG60_11007139 [Bertholletia excelsa]
MEEKKPYVAAILQQSIYASVYILNKAALNDGMSNFVFVFYRQAIGTMLLLPFAIILERKKAPHLSFVTLSKIFMLALLGITLPSNAYGLALVYTSATLAAAIANTLPVITFFLALLFRMEKLRWTAGGVAKVAGMVLCLGGVVVLALYRGPCFKLFHHPLLSGSSQDHNPYSQESWIKGCLLMVACTLCWSVWIVFQARVLEEYPSKLAFTSLQCLVGAIQSFVVAIALERNPSQWKLGWNLRMVAVAFNGSIGSGVNYYIQAWLLEKKGPVFQAMWTPASLILTILCSMFLLGEIVSLGR